MLTSNIQKEIESLNYDSTSGELTFFKKNGEVEILDMVSEPLYNEKKKQVAYIHPYQWEVVGDVYIYNWEKKKMSVLNFSLNLKEEITPKLLTWVDENNLLCLIGNVFGTVDISGKLLLISLKEGMKEKVIKRFPKDVQINSMFENKDVIEFIGIKYKDESLSESHPYIQKMKKSDILSM